MQREHRAVNRAVCATKEALRPGAGGDVMLGTSIPAPGGRKARGREKSRDDAPAFLRPGGGGSDSDDDADETPRSVIAPSMLRASSSSSIASLCDPLGASQHSSLVIPGLGVQRSPEGAVHQSTLPQRPMSYLPSP